MQRVPGQGATRTRRRLRRRPLKVIPRAAMAPTIREHPGEDHGDDDLGKCLA